EFKDAALIASKLWKNLNHDKQECYKLISQLHRFGSGLNLYDLPYIENIDTLDLWWGSIKTKPRHLAKLAI
ncbi:2725_t:CDS:1, partial [Funneliformis mosseae]